jgi:hypothetical protein
MRPNVRDKRKTAAPPKKNGHVTKAARPANDASSPLCRYRYEMDTRAPSPRSDAQREDFMNSSSAPQRWTDDRSPLPPLSSRPEVRDFRKGAACKQTPNLSRTSQDDGAEQLRDITSNFEITHTHTHKTTPSDPGPAWTHPPHPGHASSSPSRHRRNARSRWGTRGMRGDVLCPQPERCFDPPHTPSRRDDDFITRLPAETVRMKRPAAR